MIIAVYTTDDPAVAPGKRCLAQFEKLKNRLCINFYAETPEAARQKAQTFWETEVLPKARPAAQRSADEVAADAEDGDDILGDLL